MLGGVSERAGVKAGGSNLSASANQRTPSRVVMVESILVCWTAALFAGRCRRVSLGRSVDPMLGTSQHGGAPMTSDARRTPRRGTSSACATKRMHSTQAREIVHALIEDASFARSFDPCTSILTTHSGQLEWWGERVGITAGQTRGTGRNQHWGRHERTERGSSHVTARKGRRGMSRKGRRSRPPSLRGSREFGFGCPHVEVQLQKSVGDVWSQISSAYALQKERTGSSERGPRSARRSAGETVGRHVERKERRESASPVEDGRGPAQGSG